MRERRGDSGTWRDPLARVRRAWQVLVLLWAARTSWLAAAYLLGAADVARHHVETASFVLGALLLPALLHVRLAPAARWRMPPVVLVLAAGLLPLGALILYAPARHLGLLSDDFALAAWARSQTFVDPAWAFVRPVPLAIWSLLDALVGPPRFAAAVHLLNILLHGVNAALVVPLAGRFGLAPPQAVLAGLLFLAWPTHVEPVAWAAGVFDVLLTTCVLAASLVASRSVHLSGAAVAGSVALMAAAVATKETGVAAPLLVAIAVFARLGARRAGGYDAALGGAALVVCYLAWRLLRGTADGMAPLTGYAAKELLSRPFGALGVPFHADVLAAWPGAVALFAAVMPVLMVVRAWHPQTARLAALAGAWVLAGVAPVFTGFFVGPDLQGARYLYLPAAGWSMLLAAGMPSRVPAWNAARAVVAVAALVFLAWTVRLHLQPWIEAAALRDRTLAAVAARAEACPIVALQTRPDDVRGAYVFRNGLEEAIRRGGLTVGIADGMPADIPAECTIAGAAP